MNIPQSSPKANYLAHKAEIDAAIARVLESGWYILGEQGAAFERAFAEYIGVQYAAGVANGTDALEIALRAIGINAGDKVATVSHTAVATVSAIERCGAIPVMVDIEPVTYTLDPQQLELAFQQYPDIKAVIAVHIYGHPADLPAIMEIAERFGVPVIEDCAQSHGAALQNRRLGSWTQIAAFSFYPTKNLGALGDGGAVVTNSPEIYARIQAIRQYGWQNRRYISEMPGVNSRLDELQAALLGVKLKYLDEENRKRQAIAAVYDAQISGLGLPVVSAGAEHVYHQYVIRTPERDALQRYLHEVGIGALIHYPVPVHRQPAYEGRILMVGDLHETEHAAAEILSLPMFPEFTEPEKVVQAIAQFLIKAIP